MPVAAAAFKHCTYIYWKVRSSSSPVSLKTVISLLGSWPAWWESVSFKGVLVTESSVLCPRRPIASKVIQNVRLCVMIFPDSWVARRAHVTPQISPDNTLRHTGWSHSPDLAAPANLGKERKKTFPLICSIRWKRKILQHSPPVWLPLTLNLLFFFTQATDSISGAARIVHTESPNTISHYELNKHVNSLKDVTDFSGLFSTMLSLFFFFGCFVSLIAFVIDGCLNQAVATPNELLIRDSEIHSLLIWCYFSRKMRIIFSNATC